MRQGRIKAPGSPDFAYYHCVSRVVDRRFALGQLEKDQFMTYMREYEAFCGVGVVTFCIMSNHFHLLLKVPKAPKTPLSDEELLARVEKLSGTGGSRSTRQQLARFRQAGQTEAAEALRRRILSRMWDLSQFMKLLKQRFTQWFNRQHQRKGTLWEERFKSVLVESAGEALAAMAAYIDLNSVRASLTEDPMNYRWCGYGQAMAGNPLAQEGLREVIAGAHRIPAQRLSPSQALRRYRMWLFAQGAQNEGFDEQGRPLRKGFSHEAVMRVMAQEGQVPLSDYVRFRVRYFVDGAVMGTRQYVDEVFEALRYRLGRKRGGAARGMHGVASRTLYVLRDLRDNVIAVPQAGGGAAVLGATPG